MQGLSLVLTNQWIKQTNSLHNKTKSWVWACSLADSVGFKQALDSFVTCWLLVVWRWTWTVWAGEMWINADWLFTVDVPQRSLRLSWKYSRSDCSAHCVLTEGRGEGHKSRVAACVLCSSVWGRRAMVCHEKWHFGDTLEAFIPELIDIMATMGHIAHYTVYSV